MTRQIIDGNIEGKMADREGNLVQYYLYKHANGKYYAEILDPQTGARIATRSTGETKRDAALVKVAGWLATGIPSGRNKQAAKERDIKAVKTQNEIIDVIRNVEGLDTEGAVKIAQVLRDKGLLTLPFAKLGPGRENFISFLRRFWDYTESPYIKDKLAHGHTIGKNHCYQMQCRVNSFYAGYFRSRTLGSVTRQDLKDFALSLAEVREKPKGYKGKFAEKLSAAYINKIMIAGTTALAWAFREEYIAVNPAVKLGKFSGTSEKRGVLKPKEAAAILKVEWKDRRAYVGNLLSLTTGLRAGEILALRKSDVGNHILNIRHSWSAMDGLKSPKNGEARRVPLLPEVRGKILELLDENPHKVDDPFIFYGLLADKPMDIKILVKELKAACKAAGIDARARGVVFHSWRHFYSARMSDKAAAEEVMRITGHKDKAVFDDYADHIEIENLRKMERVTRKVMGNIIPFCKAAGA